MIRNLSLKCRLFDYNLPSPPPPSFFKKVVSVCRGYAKYVKVELGFVLQGEDRPELPEKLIGVVAINHLDLDNLDSYKQSG